MTDEPEPQLDQESTRVRWTRVIVAGIVQITGILTVGAIELTALRTGENGDTLPLIVVVVVLLVGVNAREVLDILLPDP